MSSTSLTHGSLFSGIGGFDLAAQWMGWNNIFQCEKDEWCRKVLAKNFPNTKRFIDIKLFNAKIYNGTIDVISGGFPCQPFSVAGQRKGKADDRYLWEEMLRVIVEVQPQFVVGENVTGIIGMALDTVLSDLEAQGYTTETFIIPACSKNAWHRRDRVWIIAYTNNFSNSGKTRKYEGKSFEKRLSKWNEVEQLAITSDVRISTNSNDTGCKEQRQPITDKTKLFAPKCSSWWKTEPAVGRVANGLSFQMDRLKGLGNAIVPQVAYEIFRSIGELYWHKS